MLKLKVQQALLLKHGALLPQLREQGVAAVLSSDLTKIAIQGPSDKVDEIVQRISSYISIKVRLLFFKKNKTPSHFFKNRISG